MAYTTHSEYIADNSSEKITIAHVHARKRLYNFTTDGSLVSRTTNNFVVSVTVNGTALTSVASTGAVTDNTKYFFDIPNSKLYLYEFTQASDEVIVKYRFFFSNTPLNLSWDLSSSDEVYYEPRIQTIPKFKSVMTQGKKGNSLIGSGSLKINNNDGFYDAIFDNMFFDNGECNVYTYHRDLNATEAQIIFRGIITGKDFATDSITFRVSDNLFKLDARIPSSTYGVAVRSEDAARTKRVIYGKVDNLLCQSIDQIGSSGAAITGTISGSSGNQHITGTGTSFLSELSGGDTVVTSNGITVTVDGIKSDTLAIVSELSGSFSGLSASVISTKPYKNKNRTFQVANHAIKKKATTVSTVTTTIRYEVADSSDFEADDLILIDSEEAEILRVTGNTLVLKNATSDPHSAGSTVVKVELSNVRYGPEGASISQSDVTISNITSGTTFTLSANAEINAAPYKRIKENFNFYNGRASVWLGTPAVYTITTVANVSASLNGTYFIIEDADAATTAFWFDSTTVSVSEPAHGADNSVAIFLSDDNLTATEVATEVAEAIAIELDYFRTKSDTDDIILESTEAQVIASPTMNTSGFSVVTDLTGAAPTSSRNLDEIISPRDIVRLGGAGTTYEVLQVQATSVTLTSEYAGADQTFYLQYKNVDYIGDDTNVYVDCLGKTKDGTSSGDLIKTTPEVVEDILTDLGLSAFIDTASFTDAAVRAPQLVSMALPSSISGTMPTANATINRLNKNCFGSLYVNQDLNLGYDVLDSDTSVNTLRTITESDVISWELRGDSFDLIKRAIGDYRFLEYDPAIKGPGSLQVSYTSEFVEKYIENEGTLEKDFYLYNTAEVQESVEREALINALSNSTIRIKGSLNLSQYRLGERVILDFTRLYNLLGASSPLRVAVITSINNTGTAVTLEAEDMGALYSRGGVMSAESTPDFDSASDLEKVQNSFMTDENEIIDDDEDTFGINLIQ